MNLKLVCKAAKKLGSSGVAWRGVAWNSTASLANLVRFSSSFYPSGTKTLV